MHLAALAVAAAIAGPFYADPDSNAARQARKYEKQGRTADARLMRSLSRVPQAFWFTGGTPKQVREDVDRTRRRSDRGEATAVLVAYNVPGRDCGGYSAGGARDYRRWIDGFADGIGNRRAVVIVEPDALAVRLRAARHRQARGQAAARGCPGAAVYVDAGHSRWQPAGTMARRLETGSARRRLRPQRLQLPHHRRAGRLRHARSATGPLRDRHEPQRPGPVDRRRRTGATRPAAASARRRPPTPATRSLDAFLWIKTPGESDGECGQRPEGRPLVAALRARPGPPRQPAALTQARARSSGRRGAPARDRPRAAAGRRPRRAASGGTRAVKRAPARRRPRRRRRPTRHARRVGA